MKLREEISHIKTDIGSLRSFAWIVGGIFLVIGLLVFSKNKNELNAFALIGSVLLAFGVLRPQALKKIYIGWMALGLIMGMFVSPILFSVLYFSAITPIALVMRMSGKQFLDFRFDKKIQSYWNIKKPSENIRSDAENQF